MHIPLAGPSFTHPSQDVNCQRSINMFPTTTSPVMPDNNKTQAAGNEQQSLVMLLSPGTTLLEDLGTDPSRCLSTFGDYTYSVCGSTVSRLSINPSTEAVEERKTLGTITTDSGTVIAAANPTQVLFADGTNAGFIYTPINTGQSKPGVIGGTASDTYNLTINGVAIYTSADVSSSPTLSSVVSMINGFTTTTGVTAALDADDATIIHLTAIDDSTITVVESGTGFTVGTDGITVTDGDFSAPLLSFRQVPDVDFPAASHVVFIGGYFVGNDVGTGKIWFSDLNNGNNWDPLAVGTAESSTDRVIALGLVKGEMWVLGTDSIEIWYNAGNPAPGCPFSPRTDLTIRIGCGAAYSPVQNNDLLTWLDSRGYIVESSISSFIRNNNSGYDLTIISDEGLTAEILGYARRDDAIACSFNDDRGHLMYQITFPTAKKTWVYDYTTKMWHEKAYFNTFNEKLEDHLGQYYTASNSLHLTSGYRNGKIYIVKSTFYDDAGNSIKRIRITSPIYDADTYSAIFIDQLKLRCETGKSNQPLAAGYDPVISLRYSTDGGHTWSNYLSRSLGKIGEYAKPITWNRLGYGREWVFEFTVDDPINFSLINAVIFSDEEV